MKAGKSGRSLCFFLIVVYQSCMGRKGRLEGIGCVTLGKGKIGGSKNSFDRNEVEILSPKSLLIIALLSILA
jgi:hypothetical protein